MLLDNWLKPGALPLNYGFFTGLLSRADDFGLVLSISTVYPSRTQPYNSGISFKIKFFLFYLR
jgi:hypothetical protein